MADDKPHLVLKPIQQLLKAMQLKGSVQVGVIGRSSRAEGGKTNGQIGAIHEFGGEYTQQRSWLRMPLEKYFFEYLKRSGLADKKVLAEVIKSGNPREWLELCAAVAEEVVQDGFDTGGFGAWPPSDMTHKKNHQTLVETQQLRNAVTTKVKVG